jgi:hypothetical protein
MLSRTGDVIAAQMLEYGMLALDLDFALSRIIASSKVTISDAATLSSAKDLLEFARKGEALVKEPRLTSNAVIAMKLYGAFLRSGTEIGKDVLDAVSGLIELIQTAPRDRAINPEVSEAAKALRTFFRAFGDDAFAACRGPLETVRVHQISDEFNSNLPSA